MNLLKSYIKSSARVLAIVSSCAGISFQQGLSQEIFSDSFDTDTSANWIIQDKSLNEISDFLAEFGYDYTQDQYVATVDGELVTRNVPPNPFSSGDSTLGLKMAVNFDEEASESSVTVYPMEFPDIEGDFSMQFEMFLSYNGGAFGGTGSTEVAVFGINGSGDLPAFIDGNIAPDGDGVFFAVAGEGGASRDYRAYTGDGFTEPLFLDEATESVGFIDIDRDMIGEYNNFGGSPLQYVFPFPEFQTPGSPGKSWVRVEIRRVSGVVSWLMNGHVIAEIQPERILKDSGKIFLGYGDPFASIADPGAENFVIYDNLRVVTLDGPGKPVVSLEGPGSLEFDPLAGVDVFVPESISEDGGSAVFTLSRTGDTTESLSVTLGTGGSATPGLDYTFENPDFTIPAGQTSIEITVPAVNDTLGELDETIVLFLLGSEAYEIRERTFAVVNLLDDGDLPFANVSASRPGAYEPDETDFGQFTFTLSSPAAAETTITFEVSGTAVSGTDYSAIETSVTIFEGETSATLDVFPIDDTELDGEKSVIVTIIAGTGYKLGEQTNAEVLIRDDEFEPGNVTFTEDFSTDVEDQWIILFDSVNGQDDFEADFTFDYSTLSIPPAPNSLDDSTTGLRLRVNKFDGDAAAAAVNVFPKDITLSGNYAVRFDLYISVDTSQGGTTEHAMMGLNHSGEKALRHAVDNGDGTWFVINTDGSNNRVLALYEYLGDENLQSITAYTPNVFGAYFPQPPYVVANSPVGQWVECEMKQIGEELTLSINNLVVFNTIGGQSGKPMFGHSDQFNSIGSDLNFALFDNIRFLELAGPAAPPAITGVSLGDGVLTLTIDGKGASADSIQFETTSALGPDATWSPVTGATVSGDDNSALTAQIPLTDGLTQFFRLAQ